MRFKEVYVTFWHMVEQLNTLLIQLESSIGYLTGLVWTKPVVYLCLFTGFFFTLRFKLVQLRSIPHAIQLIRGKYDDPNEIRHARCIRCSYVSGFIIIIFFLCMFILFSLFIYFLIKNSQFNSFYILSYFVLNKFQYNLLL